MIEEWRKERDRVLNRELPSVPGQVAWVNAGRRRWTDLCALFDVPQFWTADDLAQTIKDTESWPNLHHNPRLEWGLQIRKERVTKVDHSLMSKYQVTESHLTGLRIKVHPAWGLIRYLDISHFKTPGIIEKLVTWPHFSRIRALACKSSWLGLKELRMLGESPHCRLQWLYSKSQGRPADFWGPQGMRLLTELPGFDGLKDLNLQHNIGTEGARILANSDLRLRSVELDRDHIGDNGLRALCESPVFSGIESLSLYANGITEAGGHVLAGSVLIALKRLSITDFIGSSASEAIAASSGLPVLESIRLNKVGADDDTLRALAKNENRRALKELDLCRSEVKDDGLQAIAEAKEPWNLKLLKLDECQIGSPGLSALSRSKGFEKLETLHVSSNQIDDAGIEVLANSSAFPALRVLWLGSNPWGDEGAKALAKGSLLSHISELWCYGVDLSDVARNALLDRQRREGGRLRIKAKWA